MQKKFIKWEHIVDKLKKEDEQNLAKLNEEEKRLSAKTEKFNQERYESTGIVDNIQKGNYLALECLVQIIK